MDFLLYTHQQKLWFLSLEAAFTNRNLTYQIQPFRIRREVLLTSFYVTHVSIISSVT
jgi:hypothetical protein